ncbi:MAG TPA: proton-conducting transporter membrane subunit [Fimbriiglobus sp.]|nr:proton-conducting transporter membrane subunit [Fimbriiglobus sp.]
MSFASVPWLELAVFVPLAGAPLVGRVRDPLAASRWCLGFAAVALACASAAWAGVAFDLAPGGAGPNDLLPLLLGARVLSLDALSAPLLPLVALLHFLTALTTARTKMTRFSFAWLLAGCSLRLATFGCAGGWALGVLLALNVLPPYFELRRRGRPTRVYVLHMGLFVGLLFAGLASGGTLAAVLLMAAVLVRSGTFPAHVWVTDLFENASFGTALLFVTPITGMYAAARLVLPTPAADWVLEGIGAASLVTAFYAAGMALVQTDARRFFAYLFLSHASLILVGLELHTAVSLTGALALWGSVVVSLGGFGLTLRSIEARFGRLSLAEHRGLYGQSPSLAVCFLVTGLASVGFPGTVGFVGAEMLVDGAVGADPWVGVAVIAAAALNGIAVVRAYFLLFTGRRHASGVSLGITRRERVAVLTLTALILAGGLFPQPGVSASHRAAAGLLKDRAREPVPPAPAEH